jgi:DNA-binding response OmpR family regulator
MNQDTQKKIKILIVDDEKDFIDAVRSLLEERGYSIDYANDGIGALEIVKKDMPDLILLDIVMPNMDGITLLKKLKQKNETKDIPVIMLTVKDGQTNRNLGLGTGAYEYISKPYDSLVLLRQIRNILEKTGKLERKID